VQADGGLYDFERRHHAVSLAYLGDAVWEVGSAVLSYCLYARSTRLLCSLRATACASTVCHQQWRCGAQQACCNLPLSAPCTPRLLAPLPPAPAARPSSTCAAPPTCRRSTTAATWQPCGPTSPQRARCALAPTAAPRSPARG
jgi:hypothetical protein